MVEGYSCAHCDGDKYWEWNMLKWPIRESFHIARSSELQYVLFSPNWVGQIVRFPRTVFARSTRIMKPLGSGRPNSDDCVVT
ncbi:unnamed protein product [Phytophthora lilii]|uniref:Unnamed protein product n=1 Tax=Phytophthora lilii TaxID=2077276 RepID=A0A9W6YI14_9STRA|nr:unnamed protein product [Phytophthora lilii]